MLFLPVLAIAIILYMCGQRILSLLIFFFFLFAGFQFVPETMFDTAFGFSKPLDFALFYIAILFVWGCFFYDNYIPRNKMTLLIAIYLSVILCLVLISKFVLGIGWGDIIRTSRYFFFVLSYYVLRRFSREEIEAVLKVLVFITAFQCLLFIAQAFTGHPLLTGAPKEENRQTIGIITRFYNLPKMIYFMLFYVVFSKPVRGILGYIIAAIMVISVFLTMHRSMSMVVIITLLLGTFLSMKNIKQFVKYIPYILIVFIPLAFVFAAQMSKKTISDLESVKNGDFVDTEDVELNDESSFLFRMAHFYERYQFAQEDKLYKYFGLGLMPEDSPYTSRKFDFNIGLENEKNGETVQLDTSDISWSLFVVRYGYVGTFVYMCIYFALVWHFFVRRKTDYSLPLMLYLLLIFGCSLTSDMLFNVYMLIFPMMLYDYTVRKETADATDELIKIPENVS